MEKDQLFLEKNEPFLMLAIFPSNENKDNATYRKLPQLDPCQQKISQF